ncbi:MAG: glycoside hydrolase family 16 protein [Planctomycetes bacterium]|nr:glycoside hydrolase family 16 protein [Planctomycetota bacterium]
MKHLTALVAFLSAITTSAWAAEPAKDENLVWCDEFDGPKLDEAKWMYRGLGPRKGGVNVKEAVTLDGQGHLAITTTKVGEKYHTGMIATQGKHEWTYGYFECRVKLQAQPGHWSAFWLQSPTYGKAIGDVKQSGTEIDIFEYLARTPNQIHHNLHWDGYGKAHKHAGKTHTQPDLAEGWHTVGLDWTEKGYVFYVDGKETWRTDKGVSGAPEYIILSAEVGPWAGKIAEAKLPDSVCFDYVRVYKARPAK